MVVRGMACWSVEGATARARGGAGWLLSLERGRGQDGEAQCLA